MQVTTLTGETVTLVMPFQFAFEKVAETDFPYFRVYLKGIGKDQWYRVNEFIPGEMPIIEHVVRCQEEISMLNAQIQEAA